jgi:hypothetical protein
LPLAVLAQQSAKLPTIGFLIGGSPASDRQWIATFVQRLRELGRSLRLRMTHLRAYIAETSAVSVGYGSA